MGRTFRRNNKWKKDRRDQSFRKSKKFKNFQNDNQHGHRTNNTRPIEDPPVEEDLGNY